MFFNKSNLKITRRNRDIATGGLCCLDLYLVGCVYTVYLDTVAG